MFFRQLYVAKQLTHLEKFAEGSERRFSFASTGGSITILLRHPTSDEQTRNHWRAEEVVCETLAERTPSEKIQQTFGMVSRREIPESVDRSWIFPGDIDDEGKIRSIGLLRMEQYPGGFATYCRELFKDMKSTASRTISTLRWRLGLEQGPQPVVMSLNEQFSFDGVEWFRFPSDIFSTVKAIHPQVITDDIIADVASIVEAGQEEPLPHVLFREAWSLRSMNPRSSLLIGMAAAEVAVKSYVALVAPEARWLVENLPSPPIDKMIRDYLPTLPRRANGNVIQGISSKVVDELKKAVTLRNKVAHTGEFSLVYASLEKKLLAVRDLLWLLDYFAGHEWALVNVRLESLADETPN